jgi:hypothetical protein
MRTETFTRRENSLIAAAPCQGFNGGDCRIGAKAVCTDRGKGSPKLCAG